MNYDPQETTEEEWEEAMNMLRPTDDEIGHAISCCGTIGADMIRRLHSELLSVEADRDERAFQKGQLLDEIAVMQRERNELKEAIRYWSYCMSKGMRETCPEKCGELADLFIRLKIAPYYMPSP